MGQAIARGVFLSHEEQDLIRTEVDWLIQHEQFRASKRNKRFLEFIVDETLNGRGERIKAYTIAVDVFGRGTEFDPAIDPIVRIEATRLRLALNNFYEGAGATAQLRVTMPKGKYVPSFIEAPHRCELDRSAFQPTSVRAEPICALVETSCAAGLQSTDAVHLACDLTVESLRLCDVRVIYAPPEQRVAARKAFEAFLKEPGSAYAVDILASGTSLFWRISSLADDVILSRERLDDVTCSTSSIDAIQDVTARIAGLVASAGSVHDERSSRSSN